MKRILLILPVVMLISHSANAAKCASRDEYFALNIQALQSQLMVSALSCGQQEQYNSFMKKFRSHISGYHKMTKEYFRRAHRGAGENQLNSFITSLANQSSRMSLNIDIDKFCNSSGALFDEIISAKPVKLEKIAANQKFSTMHGIETCDIQVANKENN